MSDWVVYNIPTGYHLSTLRGDLLVGPPVTHGSELLCSGRHNRETSTALAFWIKTRLNIF